MTKQEVTIYPLSDFDGLRRAGRLAAETLDYITDFVKPGVSTGALDDLLEKFMRDNGGIPANIGYHGFPKASCISPNHVICHGIPSYDKILQSGDIINKGDGVFAVVLHLLDYPHLIICGCQEFDIV